MDEEDKNTAKENFYYSFEKLTLSKYFDLSDYLKKGSVDVESIFNGKTALSIWQKKYIDEGFIKVCSKNIFK